MADYHAILKRALSGMPSPNGETRRAVYEKARTALVTQLKAFDPPLTPSEITQQRLQLEDAIRRVESEAAKGLLRSPPTAPEVRPPAPAAEEPEPTASRAEPAAPPAQPPIRVASPTSTEADTPRPATQVAQQPPPSRPVPAAGVMPAASVAAAPPPMPTASSAPPPPPPPRTSPLEKVVGQAEALGGATAELGRQARDVLSDKPRSDAGAGTNFARTGEAVTRKTETEARRRRREEVRTGGKKTSRLPMIVGVLVAGLVFAVGIMALWAQRDAISAMLGGSAEPTIDITKRDAKDVFTPKTPDRLPGAEDPSAKVGPAKAVPTQTITTAPQMASQAGAETKPAPIAEQPSVPIAQRVTLYEEGKAGGQAQITAGQVVWQTAPYPLDGKPGAVQIKAQIDIPERRMSAVLSIHPNNDPSFPASHLIELRFDLPSDFDGQSIKQVPGIIAKATEQSRGDGLVGASAKVSDNFFWIALGGAESDRQRNVKYLRERGWFDVPLLYENGRRAILTIEKAGAGDRVVSDALTAWGDGG